MSSESHTPLTRQECKNQMEALLEKNKIKFDDILGLDIKNNNGPSLNNAIQIQKIVINTKEHNEDKKKKFNTTTIQNAKNVGGVRVNGNVFFFNEEGLTKLNQYIEDFKAQQNIKEQMINFLDEQNKILKNPHKILYKEFNQALVVLSTNQFLYNEEGLINLKKFINPLNNEIKKQDEGAKSVNTNNRPDDNSTLDLTLSPLGLHAHKATKFVK